MLPMRKDTRDEGDQPEGRNGCPSGLKVALTCCRLQDVPVRGGTGPDGARSRGN